MIQTAEQIIENVRALPKPEREKFYELLEILKSELTETESQLELAEQQSELSAFSDTK